MAVNGCYEFSSTEEASLLYISRYAASREAIAEESENESEMLKESEFTIMLSREKLTLQVIPYMYCLVFILQI